VGELASVLMEIIDCDAVIVGTSERERPQASEVERLLADPSLIRKLTGWEPCVGLREGLERTVAWFRTPHNLQKYKADIYNV
jgi:dTDP-glucose 4,6-dehydratase